MNGRYDDNAAMTYCGGSKRGMLDHLNAGLKFVVEHRIKPEIKTLIRLCKEEDLGEILALQTKVYDNLPDKTIFVRTTEEELRESLGGDVCIGAYQYDTLIGFTLMVADPACARNLGRHLGYDRQQYDKCVTYDTTFVDPDYKGYGLQKIFISLKDRVAVSMGALEALATTAPDNKYSLDNLKACGFVIADQKKMYGGYDRLILRKPLHNTR